MRQIIYRFIFLLIISISLFAGEKEVQPEDSSMIEVSGVIKIKGNIPHTMVVLESVDDVDYILTGSIADEIREKYQLQTIVIKGEIIRPAEGKRMAEILVTDYKVQ